MKPHREKVSIFETFGINEPENVLADFKKAVFGKGKIPPTKFGLSSVKIFKPQIAFPTWLGITRKDGLVPIYNFYNRNMPPASERFSVEVTYARDFTGRQWTYDSHPGTDFAIPVGTYLTACAPGRIMRIVNMLDHGGLKMFVDHGQGLVSSYAHLSRALVSEGEHVGRGQEIALSGAAGMELITFFPWVAPHLHLNVIHNGIPVDPFAVDGTDEVSMWIDGNSPLPYSGPEDTDFEPTKWDMDILDKAIDACTDREEREFIRSVGNDEKIATELINYRIFHKPLFTSFPPIYGKEYERKPVLSLPFRAEDFRGVKFP